MHDANVQLRNWSKEEHKGQEPNHSGLEQSIMSQEAFRPAKVSKELANAAYDDFKRKVGHQKATRTALVGQVWLLHYNSMRAGNR